MSQTDKTPLPGGRIWFVRGGEGNVLAEFFVAQRIVSISVGEDIGRLQPDESKAEIVNRLTVKRPNENPETIERWARQTKRFIEKMAEGDAVATYNSEQRICHLGIISDTLVPDAVCPTDKAELNLSLGYPYCFNISHRVEWRYEVSRDDLSGPAWRSLGSPQSLYRLSESTSAELRGLCAR